MFSRHQPSTIQRVSFRQPNISFDVQPESENKINDQRGAHRKKGNINKPGAYPGGSNSQAISDRGANPEGLPFNEFLKPAHSPAN
jgi:hypothetical protein